MKQATVISPNDQGLFFKAVAELLRVCRADSTELTEQMLISAIQAEVPQPVLARAVVRACEQVMQCAVAHRSEIDNLLDAEQVTRDFAKLILQPLDEAHCQLTLDRASQAVMGNARCPKPGCGGHGYSHGLSSTGFVGRYGVLRLRFATFHCQADCSCEPFRPALTAVGLGGRSRQTPACAEAVTMAAATVPHDKGRKLLHDLCDIDVSEHAIQDVVEDRGQAVVEIQQREAAQFAPYDKDGRERQLFRPADAVAKSEIPHTAYFAIDGVLPMTRKKDDAKSQEVPGARGGKGRRYELEGIEVKNIVAWRAQDAVQESDSRGWLMQRTVASFIGHCSHFAPIVWLLLLRLRFDGATRLVCLSDGAQWIRELVNSLPLRIKPILILDFYHVVMRVRETLRKPRSTALGASLRCCVASLNRRTQVRLNRSAPCALICIPNRWPRGMSMGNLGKLHGDRSAEYERLSRIWCDAIREGEVDCVIRDLEELKGKCESAAELLGYFKNNRDRMAYANYVLIMSRKGWRFRVLRWGIWVESANYHVTGARLKQQGMRWTPKAAHEMAVLGADLCNDHWRKRTRHLLKLAA